MRINKWISHNTKFSRREADLLIKNGRVKIGHKIAELSDKILDSSDLCGKNGGYKNSVKSGSFSKDKAQSQRVFIDGHEIKPKDSTKFTIIVYNKPKGELVSKSDNRSRRVIYDSLGSKFSHFIPIGRLDYASEGLLLLSDNAEVATKLMTSKLCRIYNLKLDSRITKKVIAAMEEGLILDDARAGGHKNSKIMAMEFAPFDFFEIKKEGENFTKLKVGISEGKNRELRRFFAHFGISVLDLKRVSYGFIELNALPCGKTRYLTRKEYNKIHSFLSDNKAEKLRK